MITLLFVIIVIGLLAYAVSAIPMPQPFKTIAFVVLALILVFYIAETFFGVNLNLR